MRVCRVAFCNPSLYFSSMPIESNLTSLHDLANLPGCPLKVPNFSLLCLFGTDLPKTWRRLGRGGFKKWSQKDDVAVKSQESSHNSDPVWPCQPPAISPPVSWARTWAVGIHTAGRTWSKTQVHKYTVFITSTSIIYSK